MWGYVYSNGDERPGPVIDMPDKRDQVFIFFLGRYPKMMYSFRDVAAHPAIRQLPSKKPISAYAAEIPAISLILGS